MACEASLLDVRLRQVVSPQQDRSLTWKTITEECYASRHRMDTEADLARVEESGREASAEEGGELAKCWSEQHVDHC